MTHPLRLYRLKKGIKAAEFAVLIGTSRQSLNRIENGNQTPSLGLAAKIEQATNKEVTAFQIATASNQITEVAP